MAVMTIPPPDHPGQSSTLAQLGYSIGNAGKSVVLTVFDTFLLYYLVRIAGFSPIAAGGLLMTAMLWDGGADIAVAYLADRHGRVGALGRLIVVGAPLCGLSFWMIFLLPPAGGQGAIAAAVLLCRTGFTLCDIGHNTLLVRIATTARAAATVSGMRLIFSSCGVWLVGLATPAILSAAPGRQPVAIADAAAIGGALYVGTLAAAVVATRRLPVIAPRRSSGDARALIAGLWHNRAYRDVLLLVALQAGLVPLFNRALPFVGEAAHGGAGWAGTALTVIAVAQLAALPVWMTLPRWRSSRGILILAYGVMLAALGLLATEAGGVLGSVGLVLVGVAQAGMNMAIWAMLALAVRQGAGDGMMNEALPVGLFLAVLKSSAGLGNGLLAVSIAIGSRSAVDTAGPVTAAALLLPMLGCVAALLLVIRHPRAGTSGR